MTFVCVCVFAHRNDNGGNGGNGGNGSDGDADFIVYMSPHTTMNHSAFDFMALTSWIFIHIRRCFFFILNFYVTIEVARIRLQEIHTHAQLASWQAWALAAQTALDIYTLHIKCTFWIYVFLSFYCKAQGATTTGQQFSFPVCHAIPRTNLYINRN